MNKLTKCKCNIIFMKSYNSLIIMSWSCSQSNYCDFKITNSIVISRDDIFVTVAFDIRCIIRAPDRKRSVMTSMIFGCSADSGWHSPLVALGHSAGLRLQCSHDPRSSAPTHNHRVCVNALWVQNLHCICKGRWPWSGHEGGSLTVHIWI